MKSKFTTFRIGFGYDVHKLKKGRKMFLGGVEIPNYHGFEGHSDADILIHSLCDALLGAAGLGDIGTLFPNTDSKYKNISSLILLKNTFTLLKRHKWTVENIDSMIILEKPKIFPFINKMKKNISEILLTNNISIKATTSEKLGFIGQKKGGASYTVALLKK